MGYDVAWKTFRFMITHNLKKCEKKLLRRSYNVTGISLRTNLKWLVEFKYKTIIPTRLELLTSGRTQRQMFASNRIET